MISDKPVVLLDLLLAIHTCRTYVPLNFELKGSHLRNIHVQEMQEPEQAVSSLSRTIIRRY